MITKATSGLKPCTHVGYDGLTILRRKLTKIFYLILPSVLIFATYRAVPILLKQEIHSKFS